MTTYSGNLDGGGMRIALVCGRFNDLITERLLAGARDALVRHGVDEGSITEVWAPGSFEIPLVAKRLAASGEVDAVVTLGAVIRGATGHYDVPALAATQADLVVATLDELGDAAETLAKLVAERARGNP